MKCSPMRIRCMCQSLSLFDHRVVLISVWDRKEVDDIVYEVDCSMISVKEGADVDIGMI